MSDQLSRKIQADRRERVQYEKVISECRDVFTKKMKDYGMKVIVPSDSQLKKFAKKVREVVWPEMDKIVGKSIMDICRKHAGVKIK